jgi:hypothetical protein
MGRRARIQDELQELAELVDLEQPCGVALQRREQAGR